MDDVKPMALSPDAYQTQFFVTILCLIGVIIGTFLIIYLFRRYAGSRFIQLNHKKHIKVLERRQISPATSLYHVQVGTKQFILSESKAEVRHITALDFPVE